MGVVFRQSIKSSLVVGAGAVLGALVLWLSTKYIPKREYGFLGNFTTYALCSGNLLLMGTFSTLVVYIHRYLKNDNRRKVMITLSLTVPLVIFSLATLCYLAMKPTILHHFLPEDQYYMQKYFTWLPIYTLLFIYMIVLEQYGENTN